MAQRKKLFLSLLVLLLRHMYLLPEGMRVNRCCPGCKGSAVIALALLRHRVLAMYSSEARGLPVICCAVLMTLCRFFLFCHSAVGIPSCNAVRQDTLDGAAVKGYLQFLLQMVPSKYPSEVESLSDLFYHHGCVGSPGEVLGYLKAEHTPR